MRKRYAILIISFMLAACGNPANGPSIHPITLNSVRQETRTNKKIIRITSGEWIPYTGEMLPGYGCDSRVVTGNERKSRHEKCPDLVD
jgi:hypothetical protein